MLINGWTNPKYLDEKWFSSFTVTLDKKKEVDVPVVVSCHDDSFEGAQRGSRKPSYGDLEQQLQQSKEREVRLVEVLSDLCLVDVHLENCNAKKTGSACDCYDYEYYDYEKIQERARAIIREVKG